MIKERGNINSIVSGSIVAGYRDVVTNQFTPVVEQKNLVTYGGADIMAKLISGDPRYAINGMYFKFQNTSGVPTPSSNTRESTVSSYHSLTGDNDIDWLRIPIITAGKVAKSPVDSVEYSGNSVTFVATTASVSPVGKSPQENAFSSANDSKIFSVALVAMPNISSMGEDIAFSMSNLTNPIPAIQNSYIDIFWTISFT